MGIGYLGRVTLGKAEEHRQDFLSLDTLSRAGLKTLHKRTATERREKSTPLQWMR